MQNWGSKSAFYTFHPTLASSSLSISPSQALETLEINVFPITFVSSPLMEMIKAVGLGIGKPGALVQG